MSFGIDHPLVAVRDIQAAANAAQRLGFSLNPLHQHPWGTCNHLLIFDGNMIELIGVDRPDRLAIADSNGFQFGRFIAQRLALGEGVAMTALHAQDMAADHAALRARGMDAPPPIVFRRQGVGSDGASMEVAVSLNMLMYEASPWLSQFLCQQHNPQLLRADARWLRHSNTACGIDELWYGVREPQQHRDFFERIHGRQAVTETEGGFCVRTEKGLVFVVRHAVAWREFPVISARNEGDECVLGMRLGCEDVAQALAHWQRYDVPCLKLNAGHAQVPPQVLGNVALAFSQRR